MSKATTDRGELERRGQEYYERFLLTKLSPQHKGEYVVLDPDTGDYEVDQDEAAAMSRAVSKHPDTVFYTLRVGYGTSVPFDGYDDGEEDELWPAAPPRGGDEEMDKAMLDAEDLVRRGQDYYEKHLRAKLFPEHKGKYVYLDPDTGDYEMDQDELAAMHRAVTKYPNRVFYILRVGYRTAESFGGDDGEEEE